MGERASGQVASDEFEPAIANDRRPRDGTETTGRGDLFIVGMSRGGTTWMSLVLNGHPDVAVFGETCFWGRSYIAPDEDGYYRGQTLEQVKNQLLTGTLDSCSVEGGMIGDANGKLKHVTRETWPAVIKKTFDGVEDSIRPGELFLRLGFAIADSEGKRHAIEKTPHHINWIDRILAELPHARFVVMLRGPYSFMRSYKHQGDRKSPEVRQAFQRMYHPLGCALVWRSYYRSAIALSKKLPDQTLIVDFDRIEKEPDAVAIEAQRHLGLTIVDNLASEVGRANTSFNNGDPPQLAAADLFWMNRACRREIQEFNGGLTPATVGTGGWANVVRSGLALPLWAIRTARRMSSGVRGRPLAYLKRFFQ